MNWRRILGVGLIGVVALALLLWVLRARLAEELARSYFQTHGIASSVAIDGLGLAGVSGRFALGPADAPEISAETIELHFDPLRFVPRVVEVRLVNPVIRARMAEDGSVQLPSLQTWIDGLRAAQGQSRFVSDDLAVSLTGLRVFLASPYGALELDGDLKLVRNLPVSAVFHLRPASLRAGESVLALKAAELRFDSGTGHVSVHAAGDLRSAVLTAMDFDANLSAEKLRWTLAKSGFALAAPSLHVTATARGINAGLAVANPSLDIAAQDLLLSQSRGAWEGRGDIRIAGGANFETGKIRALLAGDRKLANAVAANLAHLDLSASGHVETHDDQGSFFLSAPATLRGAAGGTLQLADLKVQGSVRDLRGALHAVLGGGGLPAITLAVHDSTLSSDGFHAHAVLASRLDYAAFQGVTLGAAGTVFGAIGRMEFRCRSPVRELSVSAFRAGATDMATNIAGGALCPSVAKLIAVFRERRPGNSWLSLRGVSAVFPFANVGDRKDRWHGGFRHGHVPAWRGVALTSARLFDRAARFNPFARQRQHRAWRWRVARETHRRRREENATGRCHIHSHDGERRRHRPYRRAAYRVRGGQIAAGNFVAAAGGVPPGRRRGGFFRRH